LGHREHGHRRRRLSDDLRIDLPPLTGHKRKRARPRSRTFPLSSRPAAAEHVACVVAFSEASHGAVKIGSAATRSASHPIHSCTCRALSRLTDVVAIGEVGVEALGAAEDGSGRRIAGSTLRHGRRRPDSSVFLRTLQLIRVPAEDDWDFFLPPAQDRRQVSGKSSAAASPVARRRLRKEHAKTMHRVAVAIAMTQSTS
jgi:hypothetical protein